MMYSIRGLALVIGFAATTAACASTITAEWNGDGLSSWQGERDIGDLVHTAEGISLSISGNDPQVLLKSCDLVSRTSQIFKCRLNSEAGGKIEIFWATTVEPKLSQNKSCSFDIVGDNAWHEYSVQPFWPNDRRVTMIRFDPPQTAPKGAKMQIGRIAIEDAGGGLGPIEAAKFPGVMFKYTTNEKRYSTMIWTTDKSATPCRHEFRAVPDGREHTYWFDLSLGDNGGMNYWYRKDWKGTIGWFGVMDMRRGQSLSVKDLQFVSTPPTLPADLEIESICLTSGGQTPIPGGQTPRIREGQTIELEISLRNLGTVPARHVMLTFDPGASRGTDPKTSVGTDPIDLGTVPASIGYDSPGGRLPNQLVTTVVVGKKSVGKYRISGKIEWENWGQSPKNWGLSPKKQGLSPVRSIPFSVEVEVVPGLGLAKADYVPEPKPIKTICEVGAISFTGWDTHPWERIRNFTPERRPLLGWYDESNPEVVDWQIKWLVENGISYLILDWFPRRQNVTGKLIEPHSHWIKAFEKARYRKYLKWAVLWENEMDGHDEAFVREMTQKLIDSYFSMPEYYRIDDKPVVYVWNRRRLNNEMAKVGGCKRALEIIREMSVAAGYKGVYFIAGRSAAVSKDEMTACKREGFDCTAVYHYRGDGAPDVPGPIEARRPFEDLAKTSLAHWRRLHETGVLPFLPSVTTGWDDRPWNADHGLEVYGRTPENFARICRDAVKFAKESGVKNFLLGPLNEWGEGSYAEPNREFGFGMYEAVRDAFGIRPVEGWPVNYMPEDVGLGPYPAKPIPKIEEKMWVVASAAEKAHSLTSDEPLCALMRKYRETGDAEIFRRARRLVDEWDCSGAASAAFLVGVLECYRYTGERRLLETVKSLWDGKDALLAYELYLLTGEEKYLDCFAGNDPLLTELRKELSVTMNIDRTLHVNFYDAGTVEADGVKFTFAPLPTGDRVKVTTSSPVKRYVRFRQPGHQRLGEQIKAGESQRTLALERKMRSNF